MLVGGAVWGQTSDKASLQKERDRITKQLATTQALLTQAQSNRSDAAAVVPNRISPLKWHYTSLLLLDDDDDGHDINSDMATALTSRRS